VRTLGPFSHRHLLRQPVHLTDRYRRHNNKTVDLSRTFRLSGLSSGAKLELVQLSRSASVVSVALQLPESEGNTRLTDKFPSTTTLWLVLRKFEVGVVGDGSTKRNLTARGAPGMDDGLSGAGRLYYQTPVIQVMGRELSSFTELQKTLAQLGFNNGSTLLRLSFRTSETTFEDAMVQIADYFQSVEGGEGTQEGAQTNPSNEGPSESQHQNADVNEAEAPETVLPTETPPTEPDSGPSDSSASLPPTQQTIPTSTGRPIQIFSPPTSSTPSAALTTYDPADYVPTIEHAKVHQRHLKQKSQNTRLPSEAELTEQEAFEAQKLKALKEIEIKVRFPDQSSAVSTFTKEDTSAAVYAFVRDDCLDERWKGEKFSLSYSGNMGWFGVPDDSSKRLIQHMGLRGRVLLNFRWDEKGGASMAALGTKDVLKKERKQEAQTLKPPELPVTPAEGDEDGTKVDVGMGEELSEKKKKGMPKWLKLPGKK
jgi:tether containing UBX domain for GLUT4